MMETDEQWMERTETRRAAGPSIVGWIVLALVAAGLPGCEDRESEFEEAIEELEDEAEDTREEIEDEIDDHT